jgi:hypothetical protein
MSSLKQIKLLSSFLHCPGVVSGVITGVLSGFALGSQGRLFLVYFSWSEASFKKQIKLGLPL